jgi:eukaryotic-like serine/threonine-protein kinase
VRLAPGIRLGRYEILSVLGAGGMAEVYQARDGQLGRNVAIKVVNESLAESPELLRRFEQEARIAGSLNHPHIVAVYDVGTHEGAPYVVTELLEGESLRRRLDRGRIPLATALDWGAQLAQGLAAAHRRGVVHRDVKPDNVFVTPGGQVKLLDFGIAKLVEEVRAGPRGLLDPTLTPKGEVTRTGSVVGTPGYMSPEQVRGEPLDARSDIFSLGAVLHEMLSGQRAFPGAGVVESGYAILNDDPPSLPASVPPSVGQVVQRCLEKEPERRFQTATDLGFALEVLRHPTATAAPLPRRGAKLVLLGAAMVGLMLGLGVVTWLRARPAASVAPGPIVDQLTFRLGAVRAARFAPDGRVIFSASFDGKGEEVFSKPSGTIEPQSLGLTDARLMAVSPAGVLALLLEPRFTRAFSMRGTLARTETAGGTPRELVENTEFADWGPSGELAVVRNVGAASTLESPVGKVLFQTTGWISNPRFSPRGDRIAFLHHPFFYDDMGEPRVVDLQGEGRALVPAWPRILGLAWTPDGSEVLFTAGGVQRNQLVAVTEAGASRTLYVSPADLRLEDVGPDGAVLVTEQFERSELGLSVAGQPQQSTLTWANWTTFVATVADDGSILFSESVPFTPDPGARPVQPVWTLFLRPGKAAAQVLGRGSSLDLSPDRRWALILAVDRRGLSAMPTGPGQERTIDVQGLEIAAGRWLKDGTRLVVSARKPADADYHVFVTQEGSTSFARLSDVPVTARRVLHLSPDDRWVATLDKDDHLVVLSTRDGAAVRLAEAGPDAIPRGWSADGHLWISRGGDRTPVVGRLIRLDVERHRVLEERAVSPAEASGAIYLRDIAISPDGRSVAYIYGRNVGYLYVLRGLLRPGR